VVGVRVKSALVPHRARPEARFSGPAPQPGLGGRGWVRRGGIPPTGRWRVGVSVVEGEKLPVHAAPERASGVLQEPGGGFGSGLDMRAVTRACVAVSARGSVVPMTYPVNHGRGDYSPRIRRGSGWA